MSKLIHNANDTRKRIREIDNDDDENKVKKTTNKKTKKTDNDTNTETDNTKTDKKTKSKPMVASKSNESNSNVDTKTITRSSKANSSTKTTTTAAAAAAKKTATTKTTKKTNNNNKNNDTIKSKNTKPKLLLKSGEESNIIYLGHLPKGFDEAAMKKFFKQFGDVKRVKEFRSEKTNRSKGYAFIQFIDHEVAATVSEAMDGYMLYEKQLVCNVVPKEKCHTGMFKKPKQKSKSTNDNEDDNNE